MVFTRFSHLTVKILVGFCMDLAVILQKSLLTSSRIILEDLWQKLVWICGKQLKDNAFVNILRQNQCN